jgi:hypothetical protein
MEKEHTNSHHLTTFLLGVTAGVIITYLLISDDKQELFDQITNKAQRLRNDLGDMIHKGKNIASEFSEYFQSKTESDS